MTEQKRLREEKDKLDREQALKAQQNGNDSNNTEKQYQPRTSIDTGRTGSIGNAISMFNKAEDKPITPAQRVSRTAINTIKTYLYCDLMVFVILFYRKSR